MQIIKTESATNFNLEAAMAGERRARERAAAIGIHAAIQEWNGWAAKRQACQPRGDLRLSDWTGYRMALVTILEQQEQQG